MELKLFVIFSALMFFCTAKIIPSTKPEEFVDILFLGNMDGYFGSNPEKALTCYNDVEKDYKSTIQNFDKSMEYSLTSVKSLFTNVQAYNRNKAIAAVKELKKIGEKMKEYQSYLRNGLNEKKFEITRYYITLVKKDVTSLYNDFLNVMTFFDNKQQKGEEKVKQFLSERRDPFLNTLKTARTWFKMCMDRQ